jgi:hypothetical protein
MALSFKPYFFSIWMLKREKERERGRERERERERERKRERDDNFTINFSRSGVLVNVMKAISYVVIRGSGFPSLWHYHADPVSLTFLPFLSLISLSPSESLRVTASCTIKVHYLRIVFL